MFVMELTASEIDRAIADVNDVIRENLRCEYGEWSWLDNANEDNWLQALEQDNQIEVPSAFTKSGKPILVRRVFINEGGAA
jgi:hypothetical protein